MAARCSSRPRRLGVLLLALALLQAPVSSRAQTEARPPLCAIDMGSNSFKRIVGSFENSRYHQHGFEKRTLGVGDDLSRHGRISDAKLAEIEQTLAVFQASCAKQGAKRALAIGTAAFREAPNGARAVEIAAKLGISMEIASERRESELAYLAGSLGQPGFAVIDNGSRSIELVSQPAGGELRHSVFNLGYRVAWKSFFADARDPGKASLAFREQLLAQAAKAPFMKGQRKLVGVEFEEMAELLFDPAETEGRVFQLEQLRRKQDEIEALRGPALEALRQ